MNLNEFKAKKKKKRVSGLDKFKDEILELWREDYSQQTIVEFLETQNIKRSQPAVSNYLNKILKTSIPKNETTKKVVETKQKKEVPKRTTTNTKNGKEAVELLNKFFGEKK